MNENPVSELFDGWGDGVSTVFASFRDHLDNVFNVDVIPLLIEILGALVLVIGVWFGVRALIRAVRAVK